MFDLDRSLIFLNWFQLALFAGPTLIAAGYFLWQSLPESDSPLWSRWGERAHHGIHFRHRHA